MNKCCFPGYYDSNQGSYPVKYLIKSSIKSFHRTKYKVYMIILALENRLDSYYHGTENLQYLFENLFLVTLESGKTPLRDEWPGGLYSLRQVTEVELA